MWMVGLCCNFCLLPLTTVGRMSLWHQCQLKHLLDAINKQEFFNESTNIHDTTSTAWGQGFYQHAVADLEYIYVQRVNFNFWSIKIRHIWIMPASTPHTVVLGVLKKIIRNAAAYYICIYCYYHLLQLNLVDQFPLLLPFFKAFLIYLLC